MDNLPIGSSKTLRSVWTDTAGDSIDPTITLTIRDPSDIVTTPVPLNPTVGTFTHLLEFDEAGIWYWEWIGETAEGTKVCEGSVCVTPSRVLVSS
jgi:hypothetical protein